MTETPKLTGIARYIEGYPDNEFAVAKFTELFGLFTPVYMSPSFDQQNDLPPVLEQASRLIDEMMERFGIRAGCDPVMKQKFITDVGSCGLHARRILEEKLRALGISDA